ncbi:tetraspanin-18-like isoform X2 [Portunus trituberculatus]|uniref:tetraspanin-18-like isoform X2 n=1 Tax=Portunus trituberculatus TaxID=210409 RepID=UPI001E1D0921|nr:tetraspanin-18-like isoform X2 [Portunus trituberculatus]
MDVRCPSLFGRDNKVIGWMRHVLTAISVFQFVVGCCLLGYMAWVLATSITVSRFLSGTLIFTYSVIGLGIVFFTTGLVGWVAGASESLCGLRLYLCILLLAVATEIGGLLALNILQTRLDDFLINGWAEVNQGTRNIVQNKFNCCGFYGPKEFAYTNYPISNSCYDTIQEVTAEASTASQTLKQSGCGAPLKFWLDDNKAVWCSVLAVFGGLQLMSIILCIHIIHKLKDKTGYKKTSEKRRLHNEKGAYSL